MNVRQFLTTNSRVPRSTFWLFIGFFYALMFTLGAVGEYLSLPEWAKGVIGLCVFPFMLIVIIVQVKRWHDLGKLHTMPCERSSGAWRKLTRQGTRKGRHEPPGCPGQ